MASFVKFNTFVEALAEKVHNLGSDVLKVALTNTAPTAATDDMLADITQISNGNGYTTGGTAATISSSAQSSGTYKLVLADVVFCASGSMGPFRYSVLYNDNATNDELIAIDRDSLVVEDQEQRGRGAAIGGARRGRLRATNAATRRGQRARGCASGRGRRRGGARARPLTRRRRRRTGSTRRKVGSSRGGRGRGGRPTHAWRRRGHAARPRVARALRGVVVLRPRVVPHRFVDEVVDGAIEVVRHLLEGVPQDISAVKMAHGPL